MTILLDNKMLGVVTGASKGNGKAIADALLEAGANVLLVDIVKCDDNYNSVLGDVSDDRTIKQITSYCLNSNYESIALINNAGVTFPSEYPYPKSAWDKTINVNLTAPFMMIEAMIPVFKRSKSGSIVNITSLGAELAFPNNPAYIASKGGLKMLTKYYAKALGKYDVTVNNLGPGYIKTDMTKNSFSDPVIKKEREKHTLLGRWGEPTDVSNVCVFLCSAESRYITGQDIYVDGGWTANGLIE